MSLFARFMNSEADSGQEPERITLRRLECGNCGSRTLVLHGDDHPIHPGYLHCNGCGNCEPQKEAE